MPTPTGSRSVGRPSRRGGRTLGRDPAGPGDSRTVRLEALPAGHEVDANRALEGDGDRRVRPWPLDARRGVVVREGRAREAVEVDRVADLLRAARALRGIQATRPIRGAPGGAVRGCGLSL